MKFAINFNKIQPLICNTLYIREGCPQDRDGQISGNLIFYFLKYISNRLMPVPLFF